MLSKPLKFLVAGCVFLLFAAYFLFGVLQTSDVEAGTYRILARDGRSGISGGTGFLVARPGYLVTNFHVIRGAESIDVAFYDDDRPEFVRARVEWQDRAQDLAILKTYAELPGSPMVLADIDASDLHKRDQVIAIGFPGAADALAEVSANGKGDPRTLFDATVSTGTVERLVPGQERLTIQHSANVNPGNSGGPLLDGCNRVIGVNTLSQTATIDMRNIVRALGQNGGQIAVQAPGSLESSVHVREVIAALEQRDLATRLSSGRCYSGLTSSQLMGLGGATALSLASFVLGGLGMAAARRNGPIGASGDFPGDFPDLDDLPEAAWDEGAPTTRLAETPRLVNAATGESHDLAALAASHGNEIIVGRSRSEADIVLTDNSVSRRHGLISLRDGRFEISDLGSSNGSRLNGRAIGASGVPLESGTLELGSCRISVVFQEASAPPYAAGSGGASGAWLISGFDRQGRVIQHSFTSNGTGRGGTSFAPLCRIGRASDNDLVLADSSVSRYHAVIGLDSAGRLAVVDEGSRNGTWFETREIGPAPCTVSGAGTLRLGEIKVTLSKGH